MKTTKPISTISYNCDNFLIGKLRDLQKAKKIQYWAFIRHKPESDEVEEAGQKSHIHLYIEPSAMLQTEDLRLQFCEYDPMHPEKPLGCLTFRSSKFDDWYLYSIHDKAYLASKGQSRKFTYDTSEIINPDTDELNFRIRQIDLLSLSPYSAMLDAINRGQTFVEYFKRGTIPPLQVRAYEYAFNLLRDNVLNRNGGDNHQ